MKALLVPDDLNSHNASVFVINASHNLSKAAFAEKVDHFVSISKVVAHDNIVVASFIVVAVVASLLLVAARSWRWREASNDLPSTLCTSEEHPFLGIIDNLATLEDVQGAIAVVEYPIRAHGRARDSSSLQLLAFLSCRVNIAPLLRQPPHFVIC